MSGEHLYLRGRQEAIMDAGFCRIQAGASHPWRRSRKHLPARDKSQIRVCDDLRKPHPQRPDTQSLPTVEADLGKGQPSMTPWQNWSWGKWKCSHWGWIESTLWGPEVQGIPRAEGAGKPCALSPALSTGENSIRNGIEQNNSNSGTRTRDNSWHNCTTELELST